VEGDLASGLLHSLRLKKVLGEVLLLDSGDVEGVGKVQQLVGELGSPTNRQGLPPWAWERCSSSWRQSLSIGGLDASGQPGKLLLAFGQLLLEGELDPDIDPVPCAVVARPLER
jgi:hypothetical protein